MPERIGLSLSGGGFRATLFHLGVIRFLRENDLLSRVKHICSVSGGSITAAHLVLNWERYNGSESEYQQAVQELVHFTKSDLRGFVIRPWMFSFVALGLPRLIAPGKWSRTKLCEAQYNRFFQAARLCDLAQAADRPALHLLSTSLTTGELVSFNDRGVEIEDEDELRHIPAPGAPVAMGVAASSAFPPLFAPVLMNAASLGSKEVATSNEEHYLTDGGVYDNLGIRKLLWINRKNPDEDFDLVVASRAERDNPVEHGNPYPFVWQRASRSTDLMMQRISWFERDSINRLEQEAGCEVVLCDLTHKLPSGTPLALPSEIESKVQTIRTDLDVFTKDEVAGLTRHAYAVAHAVWPTPLPASSDLSEAKSTQHDPLSLDHSHQTRLGLFRLRDWTSWGALALLLLYLSIPVGFIVWQNRQLELARQNARRQALVDDVVQVVDNLSGLLVSDSQQQYQIALEKWKESRNQRLADSNPNHGFFLEIFDPDYTQALNGKLEEIQQALQDSESNRSVIRALENAGFSGAILDLAHRLRNKLIADPDEAEQYQQLLQAARNDLYQEDLQVCDEILSWASGRGDLGGSRPEDVKVSRGRFRMLYWGVLGLVENQAVVSAMINFNNKLKAWERRFVDEDQPDVSEELREMAEAREALQVAIEKEHKMRIQPR